MQMIYHPDKTAKLDEESKLIADHNSSLINHAYQTLKDPFKRGLHLLNLNNLSIEEDESTKELNNEFLIQLMEINEQINENRKSTTKLKELLNEINKEKLNLLKLIEDCFKDNNYLKAKDYLIKFNFYDNAIKKIIELLD